MVGVRKHGENGGRADRAGGSRRVRVGYGDVVAGLNTDVRAGENGVSGSISARSGVDVHGQGGGDGQGGDLAVGCPTAITDLHKITAVLGALNVCDVKGGARRIC